METVPCSGVSFAPKPLVMAVSMKPGEMVDERMPLGSVAARIIVYEMSVALLMPYALRPSSGFLARSSLATFCASVRARNRA